MTNKELYLPILAEVCRKADHMGITGADYPHGLMVPYTLGGQCSSFFLGRDPYYWKSFSEMMSLFHEGNLEEYLDINERTVTIERLKQWNESGAGAGSFWATVQRTFLYIQTGTFVEDLGALTQEQYSILGGIGYSNFHVVECTESLRNEDADWRPADRGHLSALRRFSKPLASVRTLLEAYAPKTIFLMHWTEDYSIFRGLDLIPHPEFYEDHVISVFSIKDYSTKVLWTAHPRALMMKGYSQRDIAELLKRTCDAVM